jgi:hypothetical protein
MAAKKRNAHSTDASNGKSSSSKAANRPKLSGKAKSKDDEHSKRNANSVLYKICLFALGRHHFLLLDLFVLLSIIIIIACRELKNKNFI